jgi:hypothetical protein
MTGRQLARGPEGYGSIVGTVVDAGGAAVAGPAVNVIHVETNQGRELALNARS